MHFLRKLACWIADGPRRYLLLSYVATSMKDLELWTQPEKLKQLSKTTLLCRGLLFSCYSSVELTLM